MSSSQSAEKILRIREVEQVSGLKKTTIYQGVKQGTFPAPVRLSVRAVGWHAAAIFEWVATRTAKT